jgi:hypothetical protein
MMTCFSFKYKQYDPSCYHANNNEDDIAEAFLLSPDPFVYFETFRWRYLYPRKPVDEYVNKSSQAISQPQSVSTSIRKSVDQSVNQIVPWYTINKQQVNK